MARTSSIEADKLLDVELPVLDKGFIRLIDYMGGDARIVQAARVSYGDGTKTVREDSALINYLLRNDHTSPFEQVVLTFHVKTPIFIARQWIRHRTARLNEISGRYSVMKDEFYVPLPADVKLQSTVNKQARGDQNLPEERISNFISTVKTDQEHLYERYDSYLKDDVARELARINLPLSLYTEFYWQIDLHNLFHFLRLRLHSHAQKEIREYGIALSHCAKAVAPVAYAAFEQHKLGAVSLTKSDLAELATLNMSTLSPELQNKINTNN